MELLKRVPLDKEGKSVEPVEYVCYHPLVVEKLLKGEKIEPSCCANSIRSDDFDSMVKPLIKYLNDNHHPHMSIIITIDSAELVEGIKALKTDEYVKD